MTSCIKLVQRYNSAQRWLFLEIYEQMKTQKGKRTHSYFIKNYAYITSMGIYGITFITLITSMDIKQCSTAGIKLHTFGGKRYLLWPLCTVPNTMSLIFVDLVGIAVQYINAKIDLNYFIEKLFYYLLSKKEVLVKNWKWEAYVICLYLFQWNMVKTTFLMNRETFERGYKLLPLAVKPHSLYLWTHFRAGLTGIPV